MVSYRQQTGSSPGGSGNRIINPPALECLLGGRQHEETRFIHTRLLTLKKKKNVCFAGINLHERSEDCVDDRSFLPMVDTPTVTSNSVLDVRAVPSSLPIHRMCDPRRWAGWLLGHTSLTLHCSSECFQLWLHIFSLKFNSVFCLGMLWSVFLPWI